MDNYFNLKISVCIFLCVSILSCSKKTVTLKVVQAKASSTYRESEFGPGNLYDNNPGTLWNSGGYAPQWVVFEFFEKKEISLIKLYVAQTPAGETDHRIYFAGDDKKFFEVGKINQFSKENDTLSFKCPEEYKTTGVKYLKIQTLKSPSWVAWQEIKVFSQ